MRRGVARLRKREKRAMDSAYRCAGLVGLVGLVDGETFSQGRQDPGDPW